MSESVVVTECGRCSREAFHECGGGWQSVLSAHGHGLLLRENPAGEEPEQSACGVQVEAVGI